MLKDPGDSQSGSQKSISMSQVGSKRNSGSPGKRNRHRKSKRNGAESRMELNVGSRNDVGLDGTKFIFIIKILGNIGQISSPKQPRGGRVGSKMEMGLDNISALKIGSKDKTGVKTRGGREQKSRMRGYGNEIAAPPEVGSRFDFDDMGFAAGGEKENDSESQGLGSRPRRSNRNVAKAAGVGSGSTTDITEIKRNSSGDSPTKGEGHSPRAVVEEEENEDEAEEAEEEKVESEKKEDSKRGTQTFFMSKAKAKYENMPAEDIEILKKIKEQRKPEDYDL
jgi:hypothetical protein